MSVATASWSSSASSNALRGDVTSTTAGFAGSLLPSGAEAVVDEAAVVDELLEEEAATAAFCSTISAKSEVNAAVATAICDASAATRAASIRATATWPSAWRGVTVSPRARRAERVLIFAKPRPACPAALPTASARAPNTLGDDLGDLPPPPGGVLGGEASIKMKMTGCRVERGRALRGVEEICPHQALDLEGTRHADSLVAPQPRRDVAEACLLQSSEAGGDLMDFQKSGKTKSCLVPRPAVCRGVKLLANQTGQALARARARARVCVCVCVVVNTLFNS